MMIDDRSSKRARADVVTDKHPDGIKGVWTIRGCTAGCGPYLEKSIIRSKPIARMKKSEPNLVLVTLLRPWVRESLKTCEKDGDDRHSRFMHNKRRRFLFQTFPNHHESLNE